MKAYTLSILKPRGRPSCAVMLAIQLSKRVRHGNRVNLKVVFTGSKLYTTRLWFIFLLEMRAETPKQIDVVNKKSRFHKAQSTGLVLIMVFSSNIEVTQSLQQSSKQMLPQLARLILVLIRDVN